MPKVVIADVNLNDTTAWDGEQSMLPPGEYLFEVVDCTIKPPKKEGQFAQLEFDLEVVAGADSDQSNGSQKKHWLSLSPKAAGRVRNMIDACGVPIEADGGFDSDNFKTTRFIAESYEDSYDKPDLATGEVTAKVTSKLRKERPESEGWSSGEAAPAAEQPAASTPPAATAAPAAASTAPVKRTPAAAARPAASQTTPTTVATSLPRRPPVPPTRRA